MQSISGSDSQVRKKRGPKRSLQQTCVRPDEGALVALPDDAEKKKTKEKEFSRWRTRMYAQSLTQSKKEVCVSISTGGCGCVRQNCPEHCNTSCRAHQELAEGKQGTLTLVDAGIGSRALSRFNPLD